jgi:hypothetical protein
MIFKNKVGINDLVLGGLYGRLLFFDGANEPEYVD